MKIIEIGDDKYQVIREVTSKDEDFINKLAEKYKTIYDDFFLLRSNPNPATEQHHLMCRKMDDIEFYEIKECVDIAKE
jgi:hypothetical protein